ncbi:MAG: acetate kinase [Rickettsiales bacterium]
MSLILTCNAGSTNSKLAAFDKDTMRRHSHIVAHNMAEAIEWMRSIGNLRVSAISHRVVHGGKQFTQPTIINQDVLKKLHDLVPLAPLHQPAALKLIEQTQMLYPDIPQIACFDTAFHHTQMELEKRLPLPERYYQQGIQRYGFHGLSYQHIANVLPEYAGNNARGKIVAAHLGGGSSACAMSELKSVATTMGFSTLEGLMMSTRCGSLDPGAILYLWNELHMKPDQIQHVLYMESGLYGVSGISGDMRSLMESESEKAKNAIDLYCHLAAKQIAGLLPALQGLDALVFTGGIGENAPLIRERIVSALRWVGDFQTYVIPADEERVLADTALNHVTRIR